MTGRPCSRRRRDDRPPIPNRLTHPTSTALARPPKNRHSAWVRKPLIGLLVVLGAVVAAAGAYVFVEGISVPQQRPDPLAFRAQGGELFIKIGSCIRPAVTRIEVRATTDAIFDSSDPKVWSFVPEDGSAGQFSTGDAGVTRRRWTAAALDAEAMEVTVFLADVDDFVGSQIGAIVSGGDLIDGAVVEGERTTPEEFDGYTTGRCVKPKTPT